MIAVTTIDNNKNVLIVWTQVLSLYTKQLGSNVLLEPDFQIEEKMTMPERAHGISTYIRQIGRNRLITYVYSVVLYNNSVERKCQFWNILKNHGTHGITISFNQNTIADWMDQIWIKISVFYCTSYYNEPKMNQKWIKNEPKMNSIEKVVLEIYRQIFEELIRINSIDQTDFASKIQISEKTLLIKTFY